MNNFSRGFACTADGFHSEDLYVIKIGGSISTNKDGCYELCRENIRLIGEVLAKEQLSSRYRIVLVFGGGSFGNLAPQQYGLLSRSDELKNEHLPMMTTIMFGMLSDITAILTQCGLPVYPFQCSAVVHQRPNGRWNMHTGAINAALQQGCIPVITGDLVFKNNGDFMIFSSDNVPELLAQKIAVRHVLYYSDVEGLFNDTQAKTVVPRIRPSEINDYKVVAGPSTRQDVTGGMANKLSQIQQLVKLGLSVELLSFNYFHHVGHSLMQELQFGTFFEAGE